MRIPPSALFLACATLCATHCASPVLADWEGTVHFTHDPPRPDAKENPPGMIHVKKGKVRIDQTMPMGQMVMLMDYNTKSLKMLMPARKQYMAVDGSSGQAATLPPSCSDQRIDACLLGLFQPHAPQHHHGA